MPPVRPLRRLAVVAALSVGVIGTVATTAPLEECPSPPADAPEVSAFYGAQELESVDGRDAVPSEVTVDGYVVSGVLVSLPDCVASRSTDGTAETTVHARYVVGPANLDVLTEEAAAPIFDDARIRDGSGREYSPERVYRYGSRTDEAGRTYDPGANLAFALPIDIATPVVLLLGRTVEGEEPVELSLGPEEPTG